MADACAFLATDRAVPRFTLDAHNVLLARKMCGHRAASVIVTLLLLAPPALLIPVLVVLVLLVIVERGRWERLVLWGVYEFQQHVELRAADTLGGLPKRPLQEPCVVGGELGVVEHELGEQLEHRTEHRFCVATLVHLAEPSHSVIDRELRRDDLLCHASSIWFTSLLAWASTRNHPGPNAADAERRAGRCPQAGA
jgi:hypothetical protein